jgi:hypothetical protein
MHGLRGESPVLVSILCSASRLVRPRSSNTSNRSMAWGQLCPRFKKQPRPDRISRLDGSSVLAEKLGRPHSAVGSTRITVPTRSIVISKEATRRIPVLSAQATR